MATIGKPVIPAVRTNDVKSLQNAFNAVNSRLQALEATLSSVAGVAKTNLLQNLGTQSDGIVVKANGLLVTRTFEVDSGLAIKNASGVAGNPKVSISFETTDDGIVVRVGDQFVTRVLLAGSGAGITITDEDGVAGDPTFHVP